MSKKIVIEAFTQAIPIYEKALLDLKRMRSIKQMKDYCLDKEIYSGVCSLISYSLHIDGIYGSNYMYKITKKVNPHGNYWYLCTDDGSVKTKKEIIKCIEFRLVIMKAVIEDNSLKSLKDVKNNFFGIK